MPLVMVVPEFVSQAAGQLESIGSALTEATAAASAPTTGVLAPAADEVSAAITALMGSHAQEFQAVSAQATTFHNQFVGLLHAGAGAYVSTELANAAAVTGGAAATTNTNPIIAGAEAFLRRPFFEAEQLSFALYKSINGSGPFPFPAAASTGTNPIIAGAEAFLRRPFFEAEQLSFALYRSINGSYQIPLP